jgi:putative transposase
MSKKRTTYSVEFKTKIVLEVLRGEKTLNQIASENNITPANIKSWKQKFLDNAEMAMEPARAVKEYKSEIDYLKKEVDQYAKTLGKVTVERNWAVEKLKSLDSKSRQEIVESELDISISRQCSLLNISRGSLYYTPKVNENEKAIKKRIEEIYEDTPIYGYLKVHQQLLEDGFEVSPNTVHKYRKELGLRAVLAVRAPNTSLGNKEHPIYSYKLKGIEIIRANQVWSTDITYIRIAGGFVYLAAIIDWYSKAVLSWRISNSMDTDLVMGVLNEALNKYGKPEIFNTDQGSQYTSYIHTQTLKEKGIMISMDGKGRATDNICIERFWRSAKVEKIYLNEYEDIQTLQTDMREYIEFYNYKRYHETLNYKKPIGVYYESLQINEKNYAKKSEIVA